MSQTYLASFAQFAVILGFLSQSEVDIVVEGVVAIVAMANLLWALWGRWRAGGLDWTGLRK